VSIIGLIALVAAALWTYRTFHLGAVGGGRASSPSSSPCSWWSLAACCRRYITRSLVRARCSGVDMAAGAVGAAGASVPLVRRGAGVRCAPAAVTQARHRPCLPRAVRIRLCRVAGGRFVGLGRPICEYHNNRY